MSQPWGLDLCTNMGPSQFSGVAHGGALVFTTPQAAKLLYTSLANYEWGWPLSSTTVAS